MADVDCSWLLAMARSRRGVGTGGGARLAGTEGLRLAAAARLAAHSAIFWIARGRIAVRETAIARMHAATAARLITLDAHQLHGGIGYVTETDLHLWTERARLGSTLGGGADVAAAWLEEIPNKNATKGERRER